MRKTLGVCLLVLFLTSSAAAGEMPNDSPAPSSQLISAAQEPTGGYMPNGVADSLTQIALDVLAVLL